MRHLLSIRRSRKSDPGSTRGSTGRRENRLFQRLPTSAGDDYNESRRPPIRRSAAGRAGDWPAAHVSYSSFAEERRLSRRFRFYEKKRGHRRTVPKRFGSVGEALFFGFFLCVGCAALWAMRSWLIVPEWRANRQFAETTCTVPAKQIGQQSTAKASLLSARDRNRVQGRRTDLPRRDLRHHRHALRPAASRSKPSSTGSKSAGISLLVRSDGSGAERCWCAATAAGCIWCCSCRFRSSPSATRRLILIWLNWGTSAERRAAMTKRAAEFDLFEETAPRRWPTSPSDANWTNSPGTRLAYRLPIDAAPGWTLFAAAGGLPGLERCGVRVRGDGGPHAPGRRARLAADALVVPFVADRHGARLLSCTGSSADDGRHRLHAAGDFQPSALSRRGVRRLHFAGRTVDDEFAEAVFSSARNVPPIAREPTPAPTPAGLSREPCSRRKRSKSKPAKPFEGQCRLEHSSRRRCTRSTPIITKSAGSCVVRADVVASGRDYERDFPVLVHPAAAQRPAGMSECHQHRTWCWPASSGSYQAGRNAERPSIAWWMSLARDVKAVELSVLWYTEGKGEEDLAVHFFDRFEPGQRRGRNLPAATLRHPLAGQPAELCRTDRENFLVRAGAGVSGTRQGSVAERAVSVGRRAGGTGGRRHERTRPSNTFRAQSVRHATRAAGSHPLPVSRGSDAVAARRALAASGWRGQIVGPHGSGKSSLLATLLPASKRKAAAALIVPARRRAAFARRPGRTAAPCAGELVSSTAMSSSAGGGDGACAACARAAGVCWSPRIARSALPQLDRGPTPRRNWPSSIVASCCRRTTLIRRTDVARRFARAAGNLREMLFDLYDLYEARRAVGPRAEEVRNAGSEDKRERARRASRRFLAAASRGNEIAITSSNLATTCNRRSSATYNLSELRATYAGL